MDWGCFPLFWRVCPRSPGRSPRLKPGTPAPDRPFPQDRQTILGQTILINGIRVSMPWAQWQTDGRPVLGISDVGLRQLGGIDLLNTDQPERQPIAWRSGPLQENSRFLELPAYLTAQHRYLDLQPLIDEAGWQIQVEDKTLRIQTQSMAQISNFLLGRSPGTLFGPLDIAWAEGVRWQQAYVRVGGAEFPVTQLRLDLQQVGLDLRPVWPQGNGMLGIARLDETLMARGAIAGLNAGFFNRNNKAPLAALRSRGEWLSGPILDRGAIGWNEAGQVIIDRLTLTETLQPSLPSDQNPGTLPRESLESIALNSGYLKAGFSRYTAAWGLTYTPFTDNEVLIYVQGGQVIEQRQGGKAGTETFPLSLPGQAGGSDLKNYLLVARSNRSGAAKLPVGTALELTQHWSSSGLARSPNLLGAGPLLIQNRRIVLDAPPKASAAPLSASRPP
ncbi:MAG: hypothetical protein HC857_16465, partial [Synechococcales cyanobacterium RU_4_20]|nr:hypothetical protein [Synechococcales cyanobacterium RU_4_20]